MNAPSKSLHFLSFLVLAAVLARADDTNTTTVKFSDPAKPGKLQLNVMWCDVRITGADRPDVVIRSNVRNAETARTRSDGLRRLDSELTFSAMEKDNVITIGLGGHPGDGTDAELDITVPRHTSVQVGGSMGGDVVVQEIAGDVEVSSLNGEIRLQKLAGGALVECTNGEIDASFTAVPAGRPISFTSMNGEIQVHVPGDTKANVRLRTQNGAILTDFDEKALVTKTEPGVFSQREVSEVARHAGEIAREAAKAAKIAQEAAMEAQAAFQEEFNRDNPNTGEKAAAVPRTPRPPRPPRPPALPAISGGKVVSGALNGGGAEIQIATMNGTIKLLKSK
ncbi:MAG: hypothetical protein A3G75_11715 [Verrucomicrobia bacterium RIFCSPLOWO2_12_FULL_64_8]|nr:MAG: hypothetical protein A3G75_11715 [Verrucomicrobia bacterium RIFCSPLOWO2_12_FULL_64_8]